MTGILEGVLTDGTAKGARAGEYRERRKDGNDQFP